MLYIPNPMGNNGRCVDSNSVFGFSIQFTSKQCPMESKMEYDIGTLEYLFSGSLPEAGGVKSLERILYLGAVKVPISLLATLSKWIAAAWTGAKCEHQQYTPFSHHSFPSENLSYKDAATKQKKKGTQQPNCPQITTDLQV